MKPRRFLRASSLSAICAFVIFSPLSLLRFFNVCLFDLVRMSRETRPRKLALCEVCGLVLSYFARVVGLARLTLSIVSLVCKRLSGIVAYCLCSVVCYLLNCIYNNTTLVICQGVNISSRSLLCIHSIAIRPICAYMCICTIVTNNERGRAGLGRVRCSHIIRMSGRGWREWRG